MNSSGHHIDCGWQLDQYPWECTCGASRKWRVKDYADGWIIYLTEEEARASEEAKNGALVEPVPVEQ